MKTIVLTAFALMALAGNSVLGRLALRGEQIDAASFTAIRLLSGIVVLAVILKIARSRPHQKHHSNGSWAAAFMLFLYAIAFSYAYISLDTGIGALILFGAVQITMILMGIIGGHKLHTLEWGGLLVAFSGFVYLVMPGVTAPSLTGFILMTVAGIAWGFYTLAGKGSVSPLGDTAFNFLRTLPFVLILLVITLQYSNMSQEGVILAMLSGGITSGVGYTIWYAALEGLSAIQAAVVQLLVPVIATFGGVIFADEMFTFRLVLSSVLILCGVLIVILGKSYSERKLALQ